MQRTEHTYTLSVVVLRSITMLIKCGYILYWIKTEDNLTSYEYNLGTGTMTADKHEQCFPCATAVPHMICTHLHKLYHDNYMWNEWSTEIHSYIHDEWRVPSDMLAQIAKFLRPTWGPPGSCRPQIGPILTPAMSRAIRRITDGCLYSALNDVCRHVSKLWKYQLWWQ